MSDEERYYGILAMRQTDHGSFFGRRRDYIETIGILRVSFVFIFFFFTIKPLKLLLQRRQYVEEMY